MWQVTLRSQARSQSSLEFSTAVPTCEARSGVGLSKKSEGPLGHAKACGPRSPEAPSTSRVGSPEPSAGLLESTAGLLESTAGLLESTAGLLESAARSPESS